MSLSQISNPFSAGSGGASFEIKVFAGFITEMLIGGVLPHSPIGTIEAVRFQARQLGYHTDDCLISIKSTAATHKIVIQVKHGLTFTPNTVFNDVLAAAWADFTNPQLFNPFYDRIILVTEPPPRTVITHLIPILHWARNCSSSQEYLSKVATKKFSSQHKQNYLALFRASLDRAKGASVTDDELWSFLKSLYILNYDFDEPNGQSQANIYSKLNILKNPESVESIEGIWARIIVLVLNSNHSAATIVLDQIDGDIRSCFLPINGLSLQNSLKDLSACFLQIKPQVEHFISSFSDQMYEDLEAAMISAHDKINMLSASAIVEWFFESYHLPKINHNFLDGLAQLWKILILLDVAYKDFNLINERIANLVLDPQKGMYRHLVYSTHQEPMPRVVLAFAHRFKQGLYPSVFIHPIIMENHRHSPKSNLCRACGEVYNFGQILVSFCQDSTVGPYGEESNSHHNLESVEIICSNCLFDEIINIQNMGDLQNAIRKVVSNA